MSYWYGKVQEIYLKTAKKKQVTQFTIPIGHSCSYGIWKDVWLDIQWYYRRVDLDDERIEYVFSVMDFAIILKERVDAAWQLVSVIMSLCLVTTSQSWICIAWKVCTLRSPTVQTIPITCLNTMQLTQRLFGMMRAI
jgi:hypothetical protein